MFAVNKCYLILILLLLCESTKQDCPMEISPRAISVKWNPSPDALNILSNPICYSKTNELVTRNCTDGVWSPALQQLSPCVKITNHYDLNSCPPGFFKILENNTDYCYQVTQPSEWDYPCFKSGGASTITDLSSLEVNALLESLHQMNVSQYYWLPARRQKLFNPVVWTIPGPNWFIEVKSRPSISIKTSILKNCLLLDVTNRIITTEKCANAYPSLCFYINNVHYPATCPPNYQAFRFMLDDGICFGVEYSDSINGSTYEEFLNVKCKKPMGNDKSMEMTRFLYMKMASTMLGLQDPEWCWFSSFEKTINALRYSVEERAVTDVDVKPFKGVINKNATLGLVHETTQLPCMACEKEITYGESELVLDYNSHDNKIYLTVYLPSGLWKYDENDTGVRCFSNAKGFVQAVSINETTHLKYSEIFREDEDQILVDKIQYEIDPISTRMAQYWCEGHTKKFSLITSDKVIANPHGDSEHVFALIAKVFNNDQSENPQEFINVSYIVSEIFDAQKVVLMDILNYTTQNAIILLHIHVTVNDTSNENERQMLLDLFSDLESIAITILPKHNIDFIHLSSSIYCFPTTTQDTVTLEWELTEIGQIAAPNQFCLQVNGLPVKRRCGGSYMLGASWEPVEGHCDSNYQPSNTTNFLYRFVKGLGPQYWTENFMTEGLKYVLEDVNVIIPADIYYLSESLKQITTVAQANRSSLDMGDLENMAWTVDRLMVLNYNYLNLAQTLNSTNVLLDSITDLIEILAVTNNELIRTKDFDDYQLAVKPQFLTQITYPQNNNITGIALIKTTDSDLFTDLIIQPLYKNTSLEDILNIQNLELATWLPDEAFESISPNENNSFVDEDSLSDLHILINVFYNDAIFQQIDLNITNFINSRIVEVTIPGYNILPKFTIPLIFKAINDTATRNYCGYWSFQTGEHNGLLGQWNRRGCVLVTIASGMVVCKCNHLTHFAQLITWHRHGEHENRITPEHTRALNIITLFGSFLSLLGIAGIWVTAMVFSMWRKKAGTKVLLQLSVAIALPLILMIYFSLDTNIFTKQDDDYVVVDHMRGLCIGLGALLHFSILAGFVWMLITAILQFVRYVRVLGVQRPSRFMIKMSIVGWGLPTVPVFTVLLIDSNTYIPTPVNSASYHTPICYPNGIYFLVAVLVPVGVIIIINAVLFFCVMVSIAKGPDGKVRRPDLDLVKAQLRLSIFLFFLLGLTWVFGIFSFSKNYIWSYLFCLTSTMQGFVLFIYFVICDPATRNLWITLMLPQFRTTGSRVSITSINSSSS